MYQDQRGVPQETIIEKKVYEDGNGNRSVREKANAALTLGIIGTVGAAAALWGRNGGGIGSVIGGNGSSGMPANVNINYDGSSAPLPGRSAYTAGAVGCGCSAPTAFECYAHECEDVMALTKGMFGLRIEGMNAAAKAREVDVAEKFQIWKSAIDADFSLYKSGRDALDKVNDRINSELFNLYKYTRDKDDETRKEISELKARVAVNEAIRPYQDRLIQCEIDKAYTAGVNYTDRKTCHMIEGYPCIPNDTVTGLIGATGCCGYRPTTAGGTTPT